MRRRRLLGAAFLAGIALLEQGSALAKPGTRVAPSAFGRVFQQNRSALVAVRREKPGARWVDGVVIGAEGEILFGVDPRRAPTGHVEVRMDDGTTRGARLLGFDRTLGVAVAQLDPGGPRRAPPRVDPEARLDVDRWLVVLTHGKDERPTSHAGQVEAGAARGLAPVLVPGRVGSPLMSTDGALVGVVVKAGRRRTTARALGALMPFLRRVIAPGAGR